jgi:hypothetical protein
MKKWIYEPATREEKIKVHPNVVTYRTSDGQTVSIFDASDNLIREATDIYEGFATFCFNHKIKFVPDDESGFISFVLGEYTISFNGIDEDKLYIFRRGHIVGIIEYKHA